MLTASVKRRTALSYAAQAIAALLAEGKAMVLESLDSAFKFKFRFYKAEPLVCFSYPARAIESENSPETRFFNRV